jgi:hypothetical protein
VLRLQTSSLDSADDQNVPQRLPLGTPSGWRCSACGVDYSDSITLSAL